MKSLTQFQITTGRKIYNIFNFFNSVSFALVTGNIITLYALYLGANSVVIGLISSFASLSFFALPLGKVFTKKKHIMRVYADAWMARSAMLLFLLPVPFFAAKGYPKTGLLFIVLASLLFNFFRGIGLVANNPVLRDLAPGKDRGSYLVVLSLINNGAGLFATLCVAFLLTQLRQLTAFNIAAIVGLVSAFASSFLLYKMPYAKNTEEAEVKGNFLSHFTHALKDSNFKLFLAVFSIIGFGVGMARPFIAVYCREVYGLTNSMITLITFFSSLGAIVMAAVTRLFIDKIGAKPMYLIFSFASLISLTPTIFSPTFSIAFLIPVFLCFIAFLTNLGFAGEENAAQTYFFTIVSPNALMDLSMVYYILLGATGAFGSIFGGVILDALNQLGFSSADSYRIFFALQIVLIAVSIFLQFRLKNMGGYSLKNVIPLFFSPRDIKALNLLYNLEHTEDSTTQIELLTELRGSNSAVAAENLISLLNSPRFAVRAEALNSMESLPHITHEVETALIKELENGKYTTAYKAARLLGNFKIKKAEDALRKTIYSDDYILAGESMVALAKIGDERAQTMIGNIAAQSKNQYVLLWAIQAMQIFNNPASMLLLEDLLRHDFETETVHNEIILSLAHIIGIEKKFYHSFASYLENKTLALELISDLYEEIASKQKKSPVLPDSVAVFIAETANAERIIDEFIRPNNEKGMLSAMLISSMYDTDLIRLESYRFFLCFWMISASDNKKLLHK